MFGPVLAAALTVAQPYAAPPPFFIAGYGRSQPSHNIVIAGPVQYHETSMFRIEPRRT